MATLFLSTDEKQTFRLPFNVQCAKVLNHMKIYSFIWLNCGCFWSKLEAYVREKPTSLLQAPKHVLFFTRKISEVRLHKVSSWDVRYVTL